MTDLTRLHVRARLQLNADDAAGAGTDQGATGPVLLAGLAAPWNVRAQLNMWGDTFELEPGSLVAGAPSDVKLLLDHVAHPMGYGVTLENGDDGLAVTFAIPRDELADPKTATAVRQMGNGVRDALSIGALIEAADVEAGEERGTDHYRVTRARLVEVSSVVAPKFEGARHLPVAASLRAATATDDDPDDDTDTDDDDTDDTDQEGADVPTATDTDTDRAAQHAAATRTGATTATAARSRFASFGAFAMAVASGQVDPAERDAVLAGWTAAEARRRVRAALADQFTTDVPGLVPDAWLSDVVDLMGAMTPTLDAFSSQGLPDSGMNVVAPVFKQGPDVGIQPGEKQPISTRKVLVDPVSFPVETFAGGQDISIQALLRTTPDYLTLLMRLFAREMALQTNIAAAQIVAQGATAGPAWPAADEDIAGAFVDATVTLLGATLQFPQTVLLSVGAWAALGKAVDTAGRPLFPTIAPTNPAGSFQLTDGSGNVRDLRYYVEPTYGAGNWAVVGLRDAFRSFLGTPGVLSSDVPGVLGRDVAVYRFAAMGITEPLGLVRIGAAPVALAAPSSADASPAKSTKS